MIQFLVQNLLIQYNLDTVIYEILYTDSITSNKYGSMIAAKDNETMTCDLSWTRSQNPNMKFILDFVSQGKAG